MVELQFLYQVFCTLLQTVKCNIQIIYSWLNPWMKDTNARGNHVLVNSWVKTYLSFKERFFISNFKIKKNLQFRS